MHLPQDLWPMGKNAWKVNYLKLTYFKFHTIVLICTINKNWFKLKYWIFWNRYTLQKIQMEIQTYWYENSAPFLQDHHCIALKASNWNRSCTCCTSTCFHLKYIPVILQPLLLLGNNTITLKWQKCNIKTENTMIANIILTDAQEF